MCAMSSQAVLPGGETVALPGECLYGGGGQEEEAGERGHRGGEHGDQSGEQERWGEGGGRGDEGGGDKRSRDRGEG